MRNGPVQGYRGCCCGPSCGLAPVEGTGSVEQLRFYLRLVDRFSKVVLSFVPTAVTPVIITTAINAAISPYSMAVAPLSSATNWFSNDIRLLLCHAHHGARQFTVHETSVRQFETLPHQFQNNCCPPSLRLMRNHSDRESAHSLRWMRRRRSIKAINLANGAVARC